MANLLFKLTNDGTEVGKWTDRDEAIQFTRQFLSDNPEQIQSVQLMTIKPTHKTGAKTLATLRGDELVEFLEDVDVPYYELDEEE